MRFSDRVTGDIKSYAPQAKIIHLDIDPSEINKNVKVDVAIVADVKESLPALTQLIQPAKHTAWIESFAPYRQQEYEEVIRKDLYPEQEALSMAEVLKSLSDQAGEHANLVADVGQNQMVSARYFSASPKRQFIASGGLGTMGFGFPAAIGAALGDPQAETYVVCGDGGIQMTIQELGTILQYQMPVKLIILNNSYLGMVRQWQELFWQERYSSTPMINPDFVKIAQAYGIASTCVEKREDLQQAIADMIAHQGPYVLEVKVEQNGLVYPMIPAGSPISNIMMGKNK